MHLIRTWIQFFSLKALGLERAYRALLLINAIKDRSTSEKKFYAVFIGIPLPEKTLSNALHFFSLFDYKALCCDRPSETLKGQL
jgi:hypothetical protein